MSRAVGMDGGGDWNEPGCAPQRDRANSLTSGNTSLIGSLFVRWQTLVDQLSDRGTRQRTVHFLGIVACVGMGTEPSPLGVKTPAGPK